MIPRHHRRPPDSGHPDLRLFLRQSPVQQRFHIGQRAGWCSKGEKLHRTAFRPYQPALIDLWQQKVAAVTHHGLMAHRESHRSRESVVVTLSFEGPRSGVPHIARISSGSRHSPLQGRGVFGICSRWDPLHAKQSSLSDTEMYQGLLHPLVNASPHVVVQARLNNSRSVWSACPVRVQLRWFCSPSPSPA